MCTSCDIKIPYNTLNATTTNPESILKTSVEYHKNNHMLAKNMLTDDEIIYYCQNKTEYSELIQLHDMKHEVPVTHYHLLKLINSYEIYDTSPIKTLCDMSCMYFFIPHPENNIIGNSIIKKYATFLCNDLEQTLLAVSYISKQNKFFKVGMYLESIARFISEYAKYSDTTKNKLDHALRLLEIFIDTLKECGLNKGLLSALYGNEFLKETENLETTSVYASNDNKYNRLFNYVEAVNQLYLFPMLDIIIELMTTLQLYKKPNSEFIQRLLQLLPSLYLYPQNNEGFTQAPQAMLLEAIAPANKTE
jgi:hypothetical protein